MAKSSDEKEMKRQGGTLMSDAFTQLKTSSASDSPMRMLGALLKAALGAFLHVAGTAHGNMERKKKAREGSAMDIKVERKERSRAGWLLAAVGVGALAILLGVPNRYGEAPQVGVYDPDRPAVVSYEGRRWAPADRSVVLDDAELRAIGRTSEGYALFAPTGGGGGAAGPPSQLYLKAGEDRYVPVFAR